MWFKKLVLMILAIAVAGLMIVASASPGLTQRNYGSRAIEDLPIQSNPNVLKAPVVIDGREIFSVGKIGNTPAGERVALIRDELLKAIRDDLIPEVTIEQQGGLPVLYLVYPKSAPGSPVDVTKDQRYLFTVTPEDTVGRKSLQETAQDFKTEIEQGMAIAREERSSAYLQRHGIITASLIVFGLIVNRFLTQLQKYPLRKAIQRIIPGLPNRSGSQASNLTTLFRLKLGLAKFLLWTTIVLISFRLFPATRHWLYFLFNLISSSLVRSIFNLGGKDFSIIRLLILIGLIVASIFLSTYTANLLRTNVLEATRMTRGSQEIISIITKYGLIAFSTIVLLQANGINLSSLALIGSALGVGIGFGFQDIARNFASGIVLLFERSIQVGDFIQVGQHLGVVEEVRTRSIILKTLDRISIIVPNSRLLSDEVINWNHRRSVVRIHLPIGVAYGSDVQKVKSALLQAATEHLEVLHNPAPQVLFTGFGDSSLDFELLIWTSDPSRQAPLKSDLCFRIAEIFQEQQIDIPFPQRDINLKMEHLPIKLPPQLEGHLLYLLKALIAQQYNPQNPQSGNFSPPNLKS